MLRRTITATTLGLLIVTSATHADAGGALLSGAPLSALEQRIAVAIGPTRTTLWTSVRIEGDVGPVGVVIPVPPGAALDRSSDAWLEALEIATAPRVFPPEGVSATCPGEKDLASPFDFVGNEEHLPSLPIKDAVVLADAAEVSFWADVNGLSIAPDLAASLGAMSDKRFLAVRFEATGLSAVTPTLRVVLPSAEATLPLALVRATGKDLLVTTWIVGPGIGGLSGSTPATVPASKIVWNAKTGETSYEDARAAALSEAGGAAAVLEGAGHEPLSNNVPIDDGASAIEGVITTFFERAAIYGDGSLEASSCVAQAAVALASITPVGKSCPRADLGVVDGSDTCVEEAAGYTDPAALRCGDGADDLAVALSGLIPADVWLTRQSMLIKAGAAGASFQVKLDKGPAASPVLASAGVDLSECDGPDAGATTSSSSSGATSGGSTSGGNNTSSGGSPSGGGVTTDVYTSSDMDCGCSGTADSVDWSDDTWTEDGTVDDVDAYEGSDDCSGDSTDSGGDNCSGDTSAPPSDDCDSGGSESYGGDGCDSGSSGGDDCSGDAGGGDDCSGDAGSSDVDCDSGSSGGDVDCSGGSSSTDCSVAPSGKASKKRSPKLSAMTLGALAFLAPLRRLGTRRRRVGRGGSADAKRAGGGLIERLLGAIGRRR